MIELTKYGKESQADKNAHVKGNVIDHKVVCQIRSGQVRFLKVKKVGKTLS